ncbi:MAG: hypothetical protein RR942_01435 [Romboutsia sp.]
MKQKFELTLTSDYAAQWGLQEALRELIQNAVDQEVQVKDNPMDISYDGKNVLTISNKNSELKKESLLLGFSSKVEDSNTIGQFGEGYKIALLVLTRLEKKVTIYNYAKREIWTCKFVKSKRYNGQKILTIFVETEAIWSKVPNNDLTIKIEGVQNLDYQELIRRTLQLQSAYKHNIIETNKGNILLDDKFKGRIFVNGLYINQLENMKYGYDIKPEHISIGRDRDIVSDYDIQKVTSYMWRKQNDYRLHKMLEDKSPDVSYLRYSDTYNCEYFNDIEKVSESAYQNFKEKHGSKAMPVTEQCDIDVIKNQYLDVKPVLVSYAIGGLIKDSEEFREAKQQFTRVKLTPRDEFKLWKDKWYSELLGDDAFGELELIIERMIGNINTLI